METAIKNKNLFLVAPVSDFPEEGGVCAKIGDRQIAIYRFESRNEWYACDNACPHTGDMVLSRGLLGDSNGTPKVACPMHKKAFSLKTGECLSGDSYRINTYPVVIQNDSVFIMIDDSIQSKEGESKLS
ncbi:nitrite reductase (NAD(P)H) small subunit [Leptospira perolatii]|uniref:Nitrite reductase (NAD(P)H) small subunit n=1 Tax=Leptospira perolatii TaxID=2023191 RepID=A0A2M9ZRM2_9LEPT|nr:nitrite reductase small subunit NirD [Leptospira perolatii]PJZ71204.1 nitrite reductase (NAD(P)H) small subunit [Leptospira perolatii]PJZ74737.1 nitrite reductase (NAD(P)H) small subunit [Leptospira perolatii]